MWWRRLAEVQTEHQNGEERGFKWLWTWNVCWCQTGWSEYFRNCWSTGIFTHKHLEGLQRMVRKEKISSERQLCGWTCLVDVRGQRRRGRLVRDDRKVTLTQINTRYNQGMQNTISEHTTRRTWSRWATAEDDTGCRSCQLKKETEATIRTGSPKRDNRRLEKTLPGLMSYSDGRARIWRKEYESMDPSCLSQGFMLVVVV